MQWYVDENILPHCETLVLKGTEVVDRRRFGYMDLETREPLREDAIFRMYSNTKIVTSVAAMMLYEEGRIGLDDPVARFIPALSDMSVIRADATAPDDLEPARSPMTVRQILSHSAGLSYGWMEPGSLVDQAYAAAGLNALGAGDRTLEELCATLASLPLAYHPGTSWRYSFSTDVLARVVEVASGQQFDKFLKARLFRPLGMVDTDFHVPVEKQHRFTTMYAPTDFFAPMKGGLVKSDDPRTGTHSKPRRFHSGGAGLVSTVADYLEFIRMIANGGEWNGVRFLRPETLRLMRTNQLAEGVGVKFMTWQLPSTVFGLGFALKTAPHEGEPVSATDEYHWGGIAGTHSWFAPRAGIAGFCLTQRMPGFLHPFSMDFKRMAYAQIG